VGADPPERESHALGRGLLVVAVTWNQGQE
jgi:hypothetical protein